MDAFKLGIRNLLGITLPGLILVIVAIYIVDNLLFYLNVSVNTFELSCTCFRRV